MSSETVLLAAWAVWWASWLIAALWSSRAARRARSGAVVAHRVVTILGAVLLFDLRLPSHWLNVALWRLHDGPGWVLVGITVAGFVFTWWARITLGRLWSGSVTRKVDHQIISNGPYRLVRHPIYSGLLLAVTATAAMRGTVAAVLGAVGIVIGLFIKARVEEQFLRSELGAEQYDAYARHVPMLVPFTR